MNKVWIAVVALAAGSYVLLHGERQPAEPPRSVAVPAYVIAVGKLVASPGFYVNVGTGELNRKIDRVLVNEGGHLDKRDIIAVPQDEDLKARVSQPTAVKYSG